MTTPPLRIGFIGLGEHQTRAHIKHLMTLAHENPSAPLVFVGAYDPNRAAFDHVQENFGLKLSTFESSEALLESKPLEAVFISSPDKFHLEQLRMAVDKGLHVFCEKPIAVAGDDPPALFEVLQAAGRKRLIVSTCHPRRMDPPFLFIKQSLPGWMEKFGPLKSFDFSFFYHEVTDAWKKDRSLLSDHYGHEIDILRFLVGGLPFEARRVADGYDFYEVQGKMDGGPSFRFFGSRALAESTYQETVRLDFAKGSLFFHLNTGDGLELHTFHRFSFPGIDYDRRFYDVNRNFIDAVRGKTTSYLSQHDLLVNNTSSVQLTEYGISLPSLLAPNIETEANAAATNPESGVPVWNDAGDPANLAAAASDAGEWLALVDRMASTGQLKFTMSDSRAKLHRCREELGRFLEAPRQGGGVNGVYDG